MEKIKIKFNKSKYFRFIFWYRFFWNRMFVSEMLKNVVFVEKNPLAIKYLKKNIKLIKDNK